MFISTWVLWTVGIIIWLGIAAMISKGAGDYDFVSPILAVAFVLIGVAFVVGYWIGG